MTETSEIFDRALLHTRRARQARRLVRRLVDEALPDFLLAHAVEDVMERLAMIKRRFTQAVCIGSYHGLMAERLAAAGVDNVVETDAVAEFLAIGGARKAAVVASEEALPFAAGSCDLAISVLSLQYVNDLPGALAQIQKLLKPDGLFIGVVLGGATLSELRQVMLAAEADITGGASPRVMPFVDVRDAGGLLQRAGFALPVADLHATPVLYQSMFHLFRDLRAMGETNALATRRRTLSRRDVFQKAAEIYQRSFSSDDKITAQFDLIFLTGWAPDSSQPQPLRPGSATQRLADALGAEEEKLDPT